MVLTVHEHHEFFQSNAASGAVLFPLNLDDYIRRFAVWIGRDEIEQDRGEMDVQRRGVRDENRFVGFPRLGNQGIFHDVLVGIDLGGNRKGAGFFIDGDKADADFAVGAASD